MEYKENQSENSSVYAPDLSELMLYEFNLSALASLRDKFRLHPEKDREILEILQPEKLPAVAVKSVKCQQGNMNYNFHHQDTFRGAEIRVSRSESGRRIFGRQKLSRPVSERITLIMPSRMGTRLTAASHEKQIGNSVPIISRGPREIMKSISEFIATIGPFDPRRTIRQK